MNDQASTYTMHVYGDGLHSPLCQNAPKKTTHNGSVAVVVKSLYIYRRRAESPYISAKTRSWEQAENLARSERDKRDPVKAELQKIAAKVEGQG